MAHKTRYEKANELLAQASQEPNRKIREIMVRAAKRYLDADVDDSMNGAQDKTKQFLVLMVCYFLIFLSVILSFAFLSIYAAVLVIVGTFALLCLMLGVMLRMQGYLTERGLLSMVREGFKALLLLRKR